MRCMNSFVLERLNLFEELHENYIIVVEPTCLYHISSKEPTL